MVLDLGRILESALYIILSRDMPLLKPDFSLLSEFLVGLLVDIFKAAEIFNP